MDNKTFTITLGDQAENHVGMQKIGKMASEGFDKDDLNRAKKWFEERNVKCELVNCSSLLENKENKTDEEAYLLIARKGLDMVLKECNNDNIQFTSDDFFNEQDLLDKDTKAYMYGRVVNKMARHNLCFGDKNQEPDYKNGKGRIVSFDDVVLLKRVRNFFQHIIGQKACGLMAEANYYYDIKKCGIGFHGDSERKKVIGIRMGASLPLHFQWFQKSIPTGSRLELSLNHGDIYIMSEKTTGNDWKKRIF